MSRKFWQTKAFKELARQWQDRLIKAGFVDAEQLNNGKLILKQRATNCYRQANQVERESKQRYFELLGIHFHKEVFPDPVDAFVMQHRANGTQIRDICDRLKEMGERCHRQTVRTIIRKYEQKWGIKK